MSLVHIADPSVGQESGCILSNVEVSVHVAFPLYGMRDPKKKREKRKKRRELAKAWIESKGRSIF